MARIWIAFIVSSYCWAASAMLQCTGDASIGRRGDESELRGITILRFRSSVIQGWTVDRGLLLIHQVEEAPAVKRIRVAAYRDSFDDRNPPRRLARVEWIDAEVEAQPAGWMLVRVPGRALRELAADERRALVVELPKGWRVSSRESLQSAPYLFAEGQSANAR